MENEMKLKQFTVKAWRTNGVDDFEFDRNIVVAISPIEAKYKYEEILKKT